MQSWSFRYSSIVIGSATLFHGAKEIWRPDLTALERDLETVMSRVFGMSPAQGRARRNGSQGRQGIDAQRKARMSRGVSPGDDGALQAAHAQSGIEQLAETIANA